MVKYPADWKRCKLGSFVRIQRGASPRPIEDYLTLAAQSVNWIKIGDAPKNGKYIISTQERITWEGARHSVHVNLGDFILSNSMSFGRPYILKTNGCIHDGWLRLYDFQNEVDSNFLYYILSSRTIKEQYAALAAGSGVQNLNKKIVKDVEVILPPLEEQKSIANALTAFDTYIEDLTALIAKKKDIRDGALEDLVSGRTRLEGFTGAWKEGKIGDILTIMHGKNQKEVEAFNGKYPILGTGGIIGYTNNFLCNWECVLIGRKGTIDQPMYMDEPFWSIDTLYFSKSVGLKQCVKFQYYLFSTIPWHDYTESSGRPSLAKKVIESIGIKIPSLAEQQAIADTLTAMDEEIQQLEAKRDKMKDIRDGAMDDLLTGRIRLESNV